jgi:hypothetical protein
MEPPTDIIGPPAGAWRPPAMQLPGRYAHIALLDFIGEGGMAQVWMAESNDYPGISLAVKFLIHPEYQRYPELVDQFLSEARAGITITHPFIARTYQLLDLRGEVAAGWPPVALVMARHEPSLAQALENLKASGARLPQTLAIEWSRNLCDALAALHGAHGLVHRDLKPGNVLLHLAANRSGYFGPDDLAGASVLLSDLGTVCRAGQCPPFALRQDGWKAPELFRDPACTDPDHDHRADPAEDLHAFGKVLQALAQVVEGSPDWLEQVARELTDPNPQRRPTASGPLRYKLSPDWQLQEQMIEGGWKPEAHPYFTGRDFVFEAFEEFAATCRQQKQGGVFVVEAAGGMGKTALLTEWVGRGGPHPAFFFRRQEGRTRTSAMPETLFKALCRRYEMDRSLPDKEERFAAELTRLLKQIAQEKLGPGERLLLFVDGVDEAEDPEEAVQALPRPPLPEGVFVIVSSRPRIGDRDHLAPLRTAGAKVFEIAGDDRRNLDDLERYCRARLGTHLVNGQARVLAESLGGIFQLAIYFIEDILGGTMTVPDALRAAEGLAAFPVARKVYAWYQQTWERITHLIPAISDQEYLTDFVCLLAAAQAPLGEKQILHILDWKPTRRNWAQQLLRWLMVRRVEKSGGYEEAYLQLRHQSVYDFLVSVEHEGPARDGLEEMHARIGRHYLKQADRSWSEVEPYGCAFVVRHLVLARDRELLRRAAECLTSLEYIQATLEAG